MDHVKPRRPPGNAARARLPWRGLAMALLLLLGAMASAHAQIGGGHGRRQNNQQQTPPRSPAPTTPFLPEIWPRLEEGALICIANLPPSVILQNSFRTAKLGVVAKRSGSTCAGTSADASRSQTARPAVNAGKKADNNHYDRDEARGAGGRRRSCHAALPGIMCGRWHVRS